MAVAELRGLFASVIHEGLPEKAELRGLFASVIHEGLPEKAELRGLFASVIHEGLPEKAELRGLFASVIYAGYAPAASGGVQLPGEDRRPLVGNFARGRKQDNVS